MKTYREHYNEFAGYCRTLTDRQLMNAFDAERRRHLNNLSDTCYHACYDAARNEMARRNLDEDSV